MRTGLGVVAAMMLWSCGPDRITVNMGEQGHSGENGTATITDKGETVDVVISLTPPTNDTGAQPARIYRGRCGNLEAIAFTLSAVSGGQSLTTDLPVKITQLRGGGFALLVANSTTPAMYEACGNLP